MDAQLSNLITAPDESDGYEEGTREGYLETARRRGRVPWVLNKTTDSIPKDAVYIGRPSKWGNPFSMKTEADRDKVCEQYKAWLDQNESLKAQARRELKGKQLVCFCHPKRCHGHYLFEVANENPMIDTVTPEQSEVWDRNREANKPNWFDSDLHAVPGLPILPLEDGVTHINIYSRGQTPLGKHLSHFADIGFTFYEHGHFASLEGFWYWASTGKKHDVLKSVKGFKAKEVGREFEKIDYPGFMNDIEEAVRLKITQNAWLLEEFKKSELPLVHYYVVGQGTAARAMFHHTSAWFTYFYTKLRDRLCGRIDKRGIRVSITGSRSITDYKQVIKAITESGFNIEELVSGGARGIDKLGERYAKERNIPFKEFPADWEGEGKRAGILRNEVMADYVDAGIVIYDGESPGTRHYLDYMKQHSKSLYIVRP